MNKLILLATLLLLGACGSQPEAPKPKSEIAVPDCRQAPRACEGGILVQLTNGKPTAAWPVSSNENFTGRKEDMRFSPLAVDNMVRDGSHRFYWPEDEDPTGRETREAFLKGASQET